MLKNLPDALKKMVIDSVKKGDLHKIKYLADLNFNLIDPELELVHIAVKYAQPETLGYLISLGADVNILDHSGNSALTWALGFPTFNDYGKPVFICAAILLDQGANPNLYKKNELSPLGQATEHGQAALVKKLLFNGAYLETKSPDNGNTPLMLAIIHGYYDIAQLLLEAGALQAACNYYNKIAYDYVKSRDQPQWEALFKPSPVPKFPATLSFEKPYRPQLNRANSWIHKREFATLTKTDSPNPLNRQSSFPHSVTKAGLFRASIPVILEEAVSLLRKIR